MGERVGLRVIGYDENMNFHDYNITTIVEKPDRSHYMEYRIDSGNGYRDHISIGE